MRWKSVITLLLVIFLTALLQKNAIAQATHGSISGRVVDSAGAVLVGARVDVQPRGASAVTGSQGEFNISDLPPGDYTLTVHYVGFASFSMSVTVVAGQTARADASLKVATANDQIVVTAERAHGEVEA